MKNEIANIEISNKIYTIRGQQVMLDEDLAELYSVNIKRLNEQVKRNIARFPPEFMFQLTTNELQILKSQFATSSWGGKKWFAFSKFEKEALALIDRLGSLKHP